VSTFGERRCDIYCRAGATLPAGTFVRIQPRRRAWTVVAVTARMHPRTILGVTCTGAAKGDGVWVRYQGAATVPMGTR
jgi:hypothetical protein